MKTKLVKPIETIVMYYPDTLTITAKNKVIEVSVGRRGPIKLARSWLLRLKRGVRQIKITED